MLRISFSTPRVVSYNEGLISHNNYRAHVIRACLNTISFLIMSPTDIKFNIFDDKKHNIFKTG